MNGAVRTKTASGPTASARASSESKVRIINRMKATLVRLGIRGFNPKLKKAAERLEGLRTLPRASRSRPTRCLNYVATWSAVTARAQSDPADRERTPGSPRACTRRGSACHGASLGACDGHWHRDGRHAGAGGAVAKLARSTRRRALCGPHWLARRETGRSAARKDWRDPGILGYGGA